MKSGGGYESLADGKYAKTKLEVCKETETGDVDIKLNAKANPNEIKSLSARIDSANVDKTLIRNAKDDSDDPSITTTVKVGNLQAGHNNPLVLYDGNGINIVDTVHCNNLKPNFDYILIGMLMRLGDGEPVPIAQSEPTEVPPNTSNGDVDVSFPTVNLEPDKTYVVYQYLYYKLDKLELLKLRQQPYIEIGDDEFKQVAAHEDPNDKAQTIIIKNKPVKYVYPQSGDTFNIGIYVIAVLLALGVIAAVIHKKKSGK